MRGLMGGAAAAVLLAGGVAAQPGTNFSLDQALSYTFADDLVAAPQADAMAWVRNLKGVRNVWYAAGPDFRPRQVTHFAADDGQELTNLTFSPDGSHLVFVRGGDHDANWPAEGHLAPDPTSAVEEPKVTIWAAALDGGEPVKVTEGDFPAISAKGQLAYIKDDQIWTAPLDGKGKPERLFFDRGKDSELTFSPDGSALAFVSDRGDHGFIGVFRSKDAPLAFLAPSTSMDDTPRWSPDGRQIAFVRGQGQGGPPDPILKEIPHPWSIWVADGLSGAGHAVWRSSNTPDGSFPEVQGGANLDWGAGHRLVFLSEADGWPHLYSIAAEGGPATLLTPGAFMVEHVAMSRDRGAVVFDANWGAAKDDDDRRHLFATGVESPSVRPLTAGTGLEWTPVIAGPDKAAFISAGVGVPPAIGLIDLDGRHRSEVTSAEMATDFPAQDFIAPRNVSWTAPDGLVVHGQLFQRGTGGVAKPGVIFVHGGPPRQMLLGWHYMDYYSNAYAVNQYLAAHGFVVLSVNYRLGIGYGRAFQHPAHAGPAGAAEYQDVLSGAKFLQGVSGVDPARIGIWGGSYGGYLTGLALGRNSDVFKAGADLHGVHDWSIDVAKFSGHKSDSRYEEGDFQAAMKTAFAASPDADVATWTSPVILIQGDDDRNVDFHQTVDLARRLDAKGVTYEELVIPNEIHGFLRYQSWLAADTATVDFLTRKLGAAGN